MRISGQSEKNEEHNWMDKVAQSKMKVASLETEKGKVNCPLYKSSISTTNCELCQFCHNIKYNFASGSEVVKCSYNKNNQNVKESKFSNTEDKKYLHGNKEDEVDLNDFRFFESQESKKDAPEDVMNMRSKVTSANKKHEEFIGSNMRIEEGKTSIFDSESLTRLSEKINKDKEREKEYKKELIKNKKEKDNQWENDKIKEINENLRDSEFSPDDLAKQSSIKKSALHRNESFPEVSEYQLSMMDDIEEKLEKVSKKKSDWEKISDKNKEKREAIKREKKEDRSWDKNEKPKNTKNINESVMNDLINNKNKDKISSKNNVSESSVMSEFFNIINKK